MHKIYIADRHIGRGSPCFIIAEAGINHNGDINLAKDLIDAAKDLGADAIKFQTFKAEQIAIPSCPMAGYQKKMSPDESQYEMLKRLELSDSQFIELFNYCRKKKIMFLSTPFDHQSAKFLYKLGIIAFKISSSDLNNIPFLMQVASYKKPVILSTGMSTLLEVKEAVEAIFSTGNKKLILLHCTSNYPTRFQDVNLRAMLTLEKKFNLAVGYSDHTIGFEVSIAAAAMGACVIEKHFTLNRRLAGPDQAASLEPDELKKMVGCIRNIEKSLGTGVKKPRKSEEAIKRVIRKSVVAVGDIPEGATINQDMLAIKRPGRGIEAKYLARIIGKRTKVNIKKDQILLWREVLR